MSVCGPRDWRRCRMLEAPSPKVPNALLDRWMSELRGAELKIVLYLLRWTVGYHRTAVEAGLRRISKGTGLHLETVQGSVLDLEKTGIVSSVPGIRGRRTYTLKLTLDCSENPYTTVRKIRTRIRN